MANDENGTWFDLYLSADSPFSYSGLKLDYARGEIYNVSYLLQKDTDVLDTWHGRYLDLYEKRKDEWRIKERVCVHEFTKSETVSPMEIDSARFRQGEFDRPADRRLIGP